MLNQEVTSTTRKEAYTVLKDDAIQIYSLIKAQLSNLDMSRSCLHEDLLDTHMFGLSKEIDFAVRLNLIDKDDGKRLLEYLEIKLNNLRVPHHIN